MIGWIIQLIVIVDDCSRLFTQLIWMIG